MSVARVRRAVALACLGLALLAGDAAAYYGRGAEIVSASFARLEQGDDSSATPAVSADGRYVVFSTRARNLFADDDPDPPGKYRVGGVFRFDLQTRGLQLVADGELRNETDDSQVARGALSPSVSADGRFVAFSTGQRLAPQDLNANVDVYVRDMSVPLRCDTAVCPGAVDLVSAKDGGDAPAAYASGLDAPEGYRPGAEVTRAAAISADGTKVAFRTLNASSDLPDRGTPDTPPFQVFVRDRVARTTQLVTRRKSDAAPAGGAFGPAGISGDGSSVIWTGTNAPAQTRFLNGENTDAGRFYYLWRRIADGAAAGTRRVTGVSDPDDPACDGSAHTSFDETSTGPCFGPLTVPEWTFGGIENQLPSLSADGWKVAFLTGSGPRPNANTGTGLDLFITAMSPGLTRKQATEELTREGSLSDAAQSAPIESVALSGEARHIALTTSRTSFAFPRFRFLGQPRALFGPRELYAIDLSAGTIERAARATDGGDINAEVASDATVSHDATRIGFSSSATNLFPGDANGRQDVFAITRQPEPQPEAEPPAAPPDQGADQQFNDSAVGRAPRLRIRSKRLRNGAVELRVSVPRAGTARAVARGRVGASARRGPVRTVSRAGGRARRAGVVRMVLRPARRYTSTLRRRAIAARVGVTFSPRGRGSRITGSVRVVFPKRAQRSSTKR